MSDIFYKHELLNLQILSQLILNCTMRFILYEMLGFTWSAHFSRDVFAGAKEKRMGNTAYPALEERKYA
jgi:hypothetical protein